MYLPKAKNKKLIREKEFVSLAKRVKKSLEEEAEYIFEKKVKNGNKISIHNYSIS